MTISAVGAPPNVTMPGKEDAQRMDKLEARVEKNAALLGRRHVAWANETLQHGRTANDALRGAAAAQAQNKIGVRNAAVEKALIKADAMISQERFAHFGVESLIAGLPQHPTLPPEAAPPRATPAAKITPEQARELRSITKELAAVTAIVSDRVHDYSEVALKSATPQTSGEFSKQANKEALVEVRRWLTDFAIGRKQKAAEGRLRTAEAWEKQFAYQQLLWMQLIKDGEVAFDTCGYACMATGLRNPEIVEPLLIGVGKSREKYAKDVNFIAGYILTAQGAQQALRAANQVLKRAEQAGGPGAAAAQLREAHQIIYTSAFLLNQAAHLDASYYDIPEKGHRTPVENLNRKMRADFTALRNRYANARGKVGARPLPPLAEIPTKPWVLFPDGHTEVRLPPTPPSANRPRATALRGPAIGQQRYEMLRASEPNLMQKLGTDRQYQERAAGR